MLGRVSEQSDPYKIMKLLRVIIFQVTPQRKSKGVRYGKQVGYSGETGLTALSVQCGGALSCWRNKEFVNI